MPRRREGELGRLYSIEKSLKTRIKELTALYEVSKTITSTVNLSRMLNLITRKVAAIINADICAIHLLNEGELTPKTLYSVKKGLNSRLKKAIPLKKGIIVRVARTKKAIRLDELSRYAKDAFCKGFNKESMASLLVVPLIEREKVIGILTCSSKRPAAYTKDDEKELSLFASQAAVAIENARLFAEIQLNYLNTMKLLASIIDAKDAYTEDHSEHVMRSALAIANILNLSDRQKSIIKHASLVHDIGKIVIDMTTLRKSAPLTKEEWKAMRRHPRAGADIIKKAGFLDGLVPTILYHHVKYSGGGYPPTRKKRDEIPIEARILAVADAYEAMRSDRPYRKRLSKDEAMRELKRGKGTQFDPKIVNAFLKYLNRRS